MRGLGGKRVLITGGTSGIGLAAARRFLEESARVFVVGRNPDKVAAALAELRPLGDAAGMPGDVSREADVAAMVEAAASALGGIDALANNAGTAWREPFLEITPDHWDRMIENNLRGMFLAAQAVSRLMIAQGTGGTIINMSSTNGIAGEGEYAHYNASKGGVLLLTRTMAVELGPRGIRVNALCPGYIRTPLNETISDALDDADFEADYIRGHIPLGRVGTVEDVAAAYAFLASDDGAFINGAEIVIDGGQLALM
ncbi:MAG TPA: SDR family oxidoreductase [Candidatus Limnocylindrales bacterium]